MDSSVAHRAVDPGDERHAAPGHDPGHPLRSEHASAVRAEPTWFGPDDRPLFGWMHLPRTTTARGVAVICPPLGREGANAQWALQTAADQLAELGVAAFRFSYAGTGDSAGGFDDPGRLADWLSSVDEAVRFARACAPGPVVLVGMRMGALLAGRAVADGADVDGLVQWDPYVSGNEFLRQERTLLSAGYGAPQLGDGSVAGPAFTFSPATVAELSNLTLEPCDSLGEHRTLVLARRGSGKLAQARARFDGRAVDWIEVEGQPELLDVPPDMTVLPATAIKTLVEWTSGVADGPEAPVTLIPSPAATVERLGDGRSIVEAAAWLGPNRLFAVITEPAARQVSPTPDPPGHRAASGTPTLVLLSAGALDHTGPGRMWVDLARHFARVGFRTVRVDFDGIGETFGRPGQARNVPAAPEILEDVVDLAGALGDPDGTDLVYLGLSSGGYHALEAGLRLHLRGVCAINPGLTGRMPERDQGPVDPRRLAYKPMPAPLATLAVRHRRVARTIWRSLLSVLVGASPHAILAGLGRRGTPLLLIASEDDAKQFETSVFWAVSERRRHRRGMLDFVVVPGADHSLYTVDGQTQAYPILSDWIEARYGKAHPSQ